MLRRFESGQERLRRRSGHQLCRHFDRFAADANLTDVQTNDMRRVVGSSFKKMGEVWSGMRGSDLSAEERAMQREEAMVKMDKSIDLFEWVTMNTLKRHLDERFGH